MSGSHKQRQRVAHLGFLLCRYEMRSVLEQVKHTFCVEIAAVKRHDLHSQGQKKTDYLATLKSHRYLFMLGSTLGTKIFCLTAPTQHGRFLGSSCARSLKLNTAVQHRWGLSHSLVHRAFTLWGWGGQEGREELTEFTQSSQRKTTPKKWKSNRLKETFLKGCLTAGWGTEDVRQHDVRKKNGSPWTTCHGINESYSRSSTSGCLLSSTKIWKYFT